MTQFLENFRHQLAIFLYYSFKEAIVSKGTDHWEKIPGEHT